MIKRVAAIVDIGYIADEFGIYTDGRKCNYKVVRECARAIGYAEMWGMGYPTQPIARTFREGLEMIGMYLRPTWAEIKADVEEFDPHTIMLFCPRGPITAWAKESGLELFDVGFRDRKIGTYIPVDETWEYSRETSAVNLAAGQS